MIELKQTLNKAVGKSIMYSFLMLLFIFYLLFSIFPVIVLAQNTEKICLVDIKGYPGKDIVMWGSLYAAKSGKVYTGLATEGGSGHFYEYDPSIDLHRNLCDVAELLGERGKGVRSSGKIHTLPCEDNEGNIYFGTMNNGGGPRNFDYTSYPGGHWLKFDPKTDKIEDLGLVDKGVGCYALTIDKSRKYLFGITYTSYLFRFDIENRISTCLGRVSGRDICRQIISDDEGNIYGSFQVARIWKYDAVDEKVYDLPIKIPYEPTVFPARLHNPRIDRTTIWRAVTWDPVDKVLYAITCGSGSILFKYDPNDGPNGKITRLAKMCDPKYLDPPNRQDIPYSPLAFCLDSNNRKIYFVPSGRVYSYNTYVETLHSLANSHLLMYDLKKNKLVDLGFLRTTDGRIVHGCEGLSVDQDGTVYIAGYVKVNDPEKTTRIVKGANVAFHLLIYKP